MPNFRRFVKALPAIAAVLFGLDQVGGNPLTPQPDLGLEWESRAVQGQRVLALRADSGNLECWIWLQLRCRDAQGLTAKLSDGTPLAVSSTPSSDRGAWIVEISKAGGPRQAKFPWASGTELFLIHDRESMQGARIDDWEVHTASGKDDSKTREIWRRVWFGISLLLLLSVLAGAFVKEDKPPRPAPTPELFIAMAIEGIEGASAQETEKLQALLKDVVLEGARAEDALAAAAGGNRRMWFKARRQFLNRLDHLIETIRFYRRRLE